MSSSSPEILRFTHFFFQPRDFHWDLLSRPQLRADEYRDFTSWQEKVMFIGCAAFVALFALKFFLGFSAPIIFLLPIGASLLLGMANTSNHPHYLEVQKQAERLRSENDRLAANIKTLDTRCRELNSSVARFHSENSALAEEVRRIRSENVRFSSSNDRLEGLLDRFERLSTK